MTLPDQLLTPPPQGDLPPPVRLRRKTLEGYKSCPAQGDYCERHPDQTGSIEADAGNEGHDVFSRAIARRLASGELPVETDSTVADAQMSRSDVQPEVLASVRPVLWSLSRMLRGNPADILRFDGGVDARTWPNGRDQPPVGENRSGQLAMEILPANPARKIGPTIATAELDVLVATASKTVLRIIDWKCGRQDFTYTQVHEMFQAKFYAMLVHSEYPAADRVEFQLVQTRKNRWLPPVYFTKRDAEDCLGQVLTAVEARWQALHPKPGGQIATWPGETKCLWCPKLLKCDHAHHAAKEVGEDPAGFLDTLVHLQAQVKKRRALLDKYADKHGPVVSAAGTYDRHPIETTKARPYSLREAKP
jgi:hypothetical protein